MALDLRGKEEGGRASALSVDGGRSLWLGVQSEGARRAGEVTRKVYSKTEQKPNYEKPEGCSMVSLAKNRGAIEAEAAEALEGKG